MGSKVVSGDFRRFPGELQGGFKEILRLKLLKLSETTSYVCRFDDQEVFGDP